MLKFINILRQAFFKSIDKDFFSQFGEDRIINEIFEIDYANGFYVDVGCFHPIKHSNTFRLNKKGWSGINIDIEKDKINVFNLIRKKDLNVLVPVSSKNELLTVYKTQNYGVGSTTKKEFIEDSSKILKTESLFSQTLTQIINNSSYKDRQIDLLSIDTEGTDFDVLKSLNFEQYRPKVIIVESQLNDINKILKSDIYNFLLKKNYYLRSWAFYSLIFILPNSKSVRNR